MITIIFQHFYFLLKDKILKAKCLFQILLAIIEFQHELFKCKFEWYSRLLAIIEAYNKFFQYKFESYNDSFQYNYWYYKYLFKYKLKQFILWLFKNL